LVFGAQGVEIEHNVQVAAILRAGVRHLAWQVFAATDRTTIASEFVHASSF
jgi:hypothetical protein